MDFKNTQAEFSAYIRNPANKPCPSDVKPERMQVYRELFFNNIEGFLSSNFPVLASLFSKEKWLTLVQEFFEQHPCTTPYFAEIPEEFLLYLQNERPKTETDYPFMLELAHYEWVEMALSVSTENLPQADQVSNPLQLDNKISLSPLAWPLAYQFPVHKISADYLPFQTPEDASYLVVYRDLDDDVHFIELATMSFQLLQPLQEQGVIKVADYLAKVLPENSTDVLQAMALEALQQFVDKHIILLH
ncbi:MAG: putative DNA-binding domain-containing protein [Methyloprofundus sp.]|nr:putative DNA-binding domain-containing protein [Methyloprofundus sp.]